jgi:hypothetical protein
VAPATVAALVCGWLILPGHPLAWTIGIVATLAFPLYPLLLHLLAGPGPQEPNRVFFRILIEDLKTGAAQVLLQLTFLAYNAYQMVHAIALTLVRLIVTQRRLLEWETAASTAKRAAGISGQSGTRFFFGQMVASPVIAVVILLLVGGARPSAVPAAAPILILWAAAPAVAYWLSRPVPVRRRIPLSAEDRLLLRNIARKTWRYFETFMGPEDNGLPPDNFQEVPEPVVAHRTSPTNIAMGLLSTLAAHDLGYIRTRELVGKLEALLDTTEAWSATRATCSTGMTLARWLPCCRDTCPPWTAAILPELCLPSRKA